MMNNRMTGSAECLEVAHRIVACASVTAPSGAGTIQMMNRQVVSRSAPLASETVALQRFLSVAAEVKIITCLSCVFVKALFWYARHAETHGREPSAGGALRAVHLRSAMVNIVIPTIGAFVGRSDDAGGGGASVLVQTLSVVPGANHRNTRGARLLASARWFVGCVALLADALAKARPGFAVGFQSAWGASLHVGGGLGHLSAAAWTDDGSVRSCCHGLSYHGGWGIV